MSVAGGNKLFKVASQINIGRDAIVEYLVSKGFKIENKATTVLSDEMVDIVIDKFAKELKVAEKQREKVKRQQAVRKSIMESGNSVSIDTIAEQHAKEYAIEERLNKHEDAALPEPPEIHKEIEHPVARTEPTAVEARQEGPKVGEVIKIEAKEKPQVREEFVAAQIAPPPDLQPVAEERQPETKTQETAPVAELEQPSATPAEAKPEPPSAEPREVEAVTPPTEAAPEPSAEPKEAGETDEKKKRRRKGVIEVELTKGAMPKLRGLTVLGKIDIAPKHKPQDKQRPRTGRDDRGGAKPTVRDSARTQHPQRQQPSQSGPRPPGSAPQQRFQRPGGPPSSSPSTGQGPGGAPRTGTREDDRKKKKVTRGSREQVSDTDVNRAIRQTLSGMEDSGSSGRAKIRQRKRLEREEREAIRQQQIERESTTLKLSEFVTTADLANLMRVSAADIIMKCMSLGLMVSINQRLDKDTITLIASDYGFEVQFVDEQAEFEVEEIIDAPETLESRSPIVTIMGHVDHGKTSLLDYIRNANVVAGEAGGITQHIGAYRVAAPGNRHITFLDTPGHEAFTAMRARGAQVTDIVVLVVAADDSVMPQTKEAISHAQAAGVPIVVAINKIDKQDANTDRIMQQLSDNGVLVEEWGGKNQCVKLSAKTGENVGVLLEKILLEADLLELKANPNRAARATVIESHVDKGRGNVVTVIVQKGTLDVGDIFVCGQFAGRVRAMTDERGNRVDMATPSMPVQVTGFDGLPDAGDILLEMDSDAEAREIANRRHQMRREQQFRGMRHMTLDDISAQIQQGGLKELRLIVKADVGGSLEALTDSLQKLSTQEVQIRIIHRSVGAVTESDVMLASASDAIVVGFQVNIPTAIRKLAESESVDVRLYSIIYDCINEVQLALEGMLSPDIKEEIVASVEVRATFKISKLGTIAGCYVQSGKINRNDKIRVLRDGFEIFKGTLASLKRVRDDVREVDSGYECGIGIQGFNDVEIGDIIEAYKTVEIKRKLT
ncbi:MAG: translation initiation factor IF-2 [Ignavibacteria bacterium]|nr:translation initiation factor IF-2 [Ignavibacteria bacterium]